jgi:hypothetical protein
VTPSVLPPHVLQGASTEPHRIEPNNVASDWCGRASRFGLERARIDRATSVQTPTPSLAWLGQVARSHGALVGDAEAVPA